MDEPGLSDEEITALAAAFPPGPAATPVLAMAGFPPAQQPAAVGLNGYQFWSLISRDVANGIIEDGRRRLLAAALRQRPYNRVFRRAAGQRPPRTSASRGRYRVMVIGAGLAEPPPAGAPDRPVLAIRADRESRLIQQAQSLGHVTVDVRLAATVDDLAMDPAEPPDILHLICHGDGSSLLFADAFGDPRRVPAADVADLLAAYRRHAGVRLAGIVLNACSSAPIADLFTPLADTVVAHRGAIDDECAQMFAHRLYRTLRDVPDLADAAALAAAHLAADGSGCHGIRDGLVLLPPPAPAGAG